MRRLQPGDWFLILVAALTLWYLLRGLEGW